MNKIKNCHKEGMSVDNSKWNVPPRKLLKRCRKQVRRSFKKGLLPDPQPWNEDKTEFAPELFLDASTFGVSPLFDLPSAKLERLTDRDKYVMSPSGSFAYQNRVLHVGMPLELHGHGDVLFSDDVSIPTLIDALRDRNGDDFPEQVGDEERVQFGNVWMALTPNEMMSQRTGVERADGTVVIGGLGLGWFLAKVCEKDNVERVIVVDASRELLDWYGYRLCAEHSKVTDVICDDIYEQVGRHGDAAYLLDIWPTQDAVNHDRKFLRARQELGDRIWGWGVA